MTETGAIELGARLRDKVCVVTGSAHGIGAAIADRFAAEGATVVVADLDADAAAERADTLLGARALAVDVTDSASVEALVTTVVAELGGIDVLVNNAGGATIPPKSFWTMTRKEWDFVVGLNLTSPWLVTKAAVKPLAEAGSGKVVNIASVAGIQGNAGLCAYSASKGGVISMTRAMSRELGKHGICVNAIAPGYIRFMRPKTVWTEDEVREFNDRAIATQSLKRTGETTDIAGLAAYFASPDGDQVTGQVLSVDGGGAPPDSPGDWEASPLA